MTATPSAVSWRTTRKRLSTSSAASAAVGSSMTISRASWDSARAMETSCWPAADSEPTSRAGRISGWPSRAQQRGGGLVHLAAPAEAERGRLVAEEDVLRHRQAVDQVQLLVHGGEAGPQRGDRGRERRRLVLPRDLAAVGLVRAGQHLDQRGLAGAVLAEQAVHLAGADLEVDTVQRPHAGEDLHDPADLE